MTEEVQSKSSTEQKTESSPEPKPESTSNQISSNLRRILALEFTVLGIVSGVISFYINSPLISLGVAIVVCAIAGYVTKHTLRSRLAGTGKWWASPFTIYVGIWIISWTILYNIYTVKPF